ncbi:MAG: lipoprotein [Burkholderiaceae bacterium]|nr:lipoprotein [Burkholderiaceae bacterium]
MKVESILVAAALALLLGACGNKGPLHLPGATPSAPWPYPQPSPKPTAEPRKPAEVPAASDPAR